MRRILSATLAVIILLMSSPTPYAKAEDTYTNEEILTEVAYAYDRQGEQILYDQLNARRSIYASPEDATKQKTIFLDCSSFVNSCYREAFGVNIMPSEITSAGGPPSTANYDKYAKEHTEAVDVVGYWEPQTYTTDVQRQAVVDDIYETLRTGDVLTYRHGKKTSTKGHVYIYLGNKIFIHCAGAGSYVADSADPSQSYDSRASEVTSKGTITTIGASSILEDKESSRYLFKATETDTVWSFGIIRPFARGLTPTQKALDRMKISGLSMEKVCSAYENTSVNTGDILTYTVSIENTNTYASEDVRITDTIPEGTEFVSGDEGVEAEGNTVSWKGNVPSKETVEISYSVRVTETSPGALIVSDKTYVSGIKLGKTTHSVSAFDSTQLYLAGNAAIKYAENAEKFDNSIAMVKSVYKSSLNTEIFDLSTPEDILNQIIDIPGTTIYKNTELSKMVAPNLYGGLSIRYGWRDLPSENDRIRLPKEENLSVGDIIVADWANGNDVYFYAGNKTLVTVKDGETKALTIGDDIYTPGDNIIISLLGYDRYAVLRPSMKNLVSDVCVKSISIKNNPTKLVYDSGENFDSAGMIVEAVLSDGTAIEIKNYDVSPKNLVYPTNSVTISFGNHSTNLDIKVLKTVRNVREVSGFALGSEITVEGIVLGISDEGSSNDKELIIKDTQTDSLVAVRNIPYGTFPDLGYKKGDRIKFDATVRKDTTASTSYKLKKYLEFSSSNGTIDETIVSAGNKPDFKFDNVIEIDSWEDMQSVFVKAELKPYTYLKFTDGAYLHRYNGKDTINYRLHKNPLATAVDGIKPDGSISVCMRDNVMTKNLGAEWKTLLGLGDVSTDYPGTYVNKDFYAVYTGGNKTYYQLAIYDESWISEPCFSIKGLSSDMNKADVYIPKAGSYFVIFADYEKHEENGISYLRDISVTEVNVADKDIGYASVEPEKTINLSKDDKIMIWDKNEQSGTKPLSEAFVIK